MATGASDTLVTQEVKVTGNWDFSTGLNASVGNKLEDLDGPDFRHGRGHRVWHTDSFELPGKPG